MFEFFYKSHIFRLDFCFILCPFLIFLSLLYSNIKKITLFFSLHIHMSRDKKEIQFDYFKYEYKGSVLGVFRIDKTDNKPYMMNLNRRFLQI